MKYLWLILAHSAVAGEVRTTDENVATEDKGTIQPLAWQSTMGKQVFTSFL
jgi:hypothetical protein